MKIETQAHTCRKCYSKEIVKHGTNGCSNPQYHCKTCGAYGVLDPRDRYTEEDKERVIKAYQERSSMRGIARTYGVCRHTLSAWLKNKAEQLPPFETSLKPVDPGQTPVLEVDELWSFFFSSAIKVWIGGVLNRETREVVAYACGDRNEETCRILWNRIPPAYKKAAVFSDYWKAYQAVIPDEQHCPAGKETGAAACVERWNNTLRQHLPRFIRKTLSFSKCIHMHEICLRFFLHCCNTELLPSVG